MIRSARYIAVEFLEFTWYNFIAKMRLTGNVPMSLQNFRVERRGGEGEEEREVEGGGNPAPKLMQVVYSVNDSRQFCNTQTCTHLQKNVHKYKTTCVKQKPIPKNTQKR